MCSYVLHFLLVLTGLATLGAVVYFGKMLVLVRMLRTGKEAGG